VRINKFIIGTAKFGMKYGFYKKETSLKQVEKILLYAKKSGINILDTALTYNNAFDKLAKVGVKDWSIISKIPSLPKEVKDIKAWVYKITFLTLEKLKISKIDTMLIHDEENVINLKIGKKIFNSLEELKKNKLIKNIGCSIYDSYKIKKIINCYNFDLVQCPFNILDTRIYSSGLAEILHKKNIKLHLRSIFLQGLLLKSSKLPKKFKNNKILQSFDKWLANNNKNNINVCLSFVSKFNFDKLIVGVSNLKQFQEIIDRSKNLTNELPEFIIKNNNKLIDPRKW